MAEREKDNLSGPEDEGLAENEAATDGESAGEPELLPDPLSDDVERTPIRTAVLVINVLSILLLHPTASRLGIPGTVMWVLYAAAFVCFFQAFAFRDRSKYVMALLLPLLPFAAAIILSLF